MATDWDALTYAQRAQKIEDWANTHNNSIRPKQTVPLPSFVPSSAYNKTN